MREPVTTTTATTPSKWSVLSLSVPLAIITAVAAWLYFFGQVND